MNASGPLLRWETQLLDAFELTGSGSHQPCPATLACAATWLTQGVPIVIPTETVYGLAAPALDREAVRAIFRIKQRPLDNPLIVHVTGSAQLESVGAQLSPLAAQLAQAFWPGPLTLVVASQASLPWVTAGLDSIAVRHPAHEFASALIRRVGPLAAPSANLSGLPSPTRALHAAHDLRGRVPLVVDAGDLEHGVESTVIDARGDTPILLRPGAVTAEELEACCGQKVRMPVVGSVARSPGMRYRHYSPRAEVWLYPPGASSAPRFSDDARQLRASGRRVAAIANCRVEVDHFIPLPADTRELGRRLFGWLRELDELGVDHILVEGVSGLGVGRAIMDRLERAASRIHSSEPDGAALRGSTL